jgi:hypothetical protein
MPEHPSDQAPRGEVLVAIMNKASDFGILQNHGWYRIPVDTAPKRWPPKWLAFYQTKVFGEMQYSINYFGRISSMCSFPQHGASSPQQWRSMTSSMRVHWKTGCGQNSSASKSVLSDNWKSELNRSGTGLILPSSASMDASMWRPTVTHGTQRRSAFHWTIAGTTRLGQTVGVCYVSAAAKSANRLRAYAFPRSPGQSAIWEVSPTGGWFHESFTIPQTDWRSS